MISDVRGHGEPPADCGIFNPHCIEYFPYAGHAEIWVNGSPWANRAVAHLITVTHHMEFAGPDDLLFDLMGIEIGWLRSYDPDADHPYVDVLELMPAVGWITASKTAPGMYWLEGQLTVRPVRVTSSSFTVYDDMTLYVGVPEPATALYMSSGLLVFVSFFRCLGRRGLRKPNQVVAAGPVTHERSGSPTGGGSAKISPDPDTAFDAL